MVSRSDDLSPMISRAARALIHSLVALAALTTVASAAYAQPTLSKVFTPDTIGPGSVSQITLTITNVSPSVVTGLGFTDVLPVMPGPMTIADPANASTTCDLGMSGTLSAPDGGTTIILSDAQIGAFQSCTINVDVTASTPGAHTNPAVTLSSSAGSSMSLPIDLTVATDRPGFSKSFAPDAISLGGRSTLTLTVDNSANLSALSSLVFSDVFPPGLEIADPANASTTCAGPDPMLSAVAGTSVVSFSSFGILFPGFEVMLAGETCTVVVDVTATTAGMLDNVTSDLTSNAGSSGKASGTLDVMVTPITLTKAFTDDPVPPGGTVTLDFQIFNFDRNLSATDIAFTDDLDAALTGLTFDSLLSNDCGGTVAGTGTTLIDFMGGTLSAEGSCTISVSVAVPVGAAPGIYTNTTGTVTGDVGGSPIAGNMASDDLFVSPAPVVTKTFTDDPAEPGDTVVLEFTVTNTSTTSSATDIAFSDRFATILPTASMTPGNGCCGAGSTCTFTPLSNPPPPSDVFPATLTISGGTLAPAGMAGDSCTFSITLDVFSGAAPGIYPNTTSEITATVDGATRTGDPATDDLTIIAAPRLTKVFTDDPIAPGGTVTLEFTLSHSQNSATAATDIMFTDDLAPVLAGLTANLPSTPDPPCGAGSSLTGSAGDTLLTLMGGTLMPDEECTFSVTLDVPMGAAPGSYKNTTSGVTATVSGAPATSAPASDDLNVAGINFTKEFLGDPVIAGDTVTLRFTIANIHPTDDATITFFTDNLAANLPGLAATGGPSVNTCGGMLSGTTFLTYVGGSVLSGETCAIEVEVLVPAAANDGEYLNVTSSLSATQGGGAVVIDPAVDLLTVNSNLILLAKAFTDDPVAPGATVTLEFTLTNADTGQAASAIGFTDDLAAALPGLTFDSVLLDTCLGTVSGTGTTMITVSGASLVAGGSCTIRVSLTVPGATAANFYTNTTSDATGMIGGLPVTGDAASDVLEVIQLLEFSKAFDGPTTATGMATLTFTITNPGTDTASNLSFSDDLDAAISGLIAISLPAVPCGAGSSITGTSFLAFTGGELPPMGGMCSFDVDVLVPASATAGTFPNVTSDLTRDGLTVSEPAMADLVIEPPPTFAKAFAPAFIGVGQTSTLTFTVDNSASAVAATSLAFVDNLPAGVTVATPSVTSNTCGGTLTATAGSGTISLAGASVGAGASCTVQADVTASMAGAFVNTTGDLTSSSGNSGTATDTLTANPQPGFAKVFAPDTIVGGAVSTLTFTIDNTGSTVATTALAFMDTLPTAVTVATPANVVNSCGGTVTATPGTGTISLTGGTAAAAGTCTISVDTTSATVGSHVNLSGDLTSSLGSSGTATDTLVVVPAPTFAKVFAPDTINVGATSTLTFTIDNTASTLAATALDFTDTMPVEITVETPANVVNTCGGTATAISGTSVISLTGGTVGAGATCTLSVDVTSVNAGMHVNLSGDLTSSSGNSGTATDTLTANPRSGFSKVFAPDVIPSGFVSTLTFTIDNGTATVAATDIAFTDTMPAAIIVATPANVTNTCTGGTVTATPGTSVISYMGGEVAAGATCTLSVDVTSTTVGMHVNLTGDLTSSLGNSGTATDTLTVNPQPGFAKVFAPDVILLNAISTLTFTVDNTGSTVAATSLDFTDMMPMEIVVATPANVVNTCTGGMVTATPGTSVIAYSGGTAAAGASCALSVDVTSSTPGLHLNLTGDLTSSLGNSGTATDALTVNPPPTFAKAFGPNPIVAGTTSTLVFTIGNGASTVDATALAFVDNLPAGLVVAMPANASMTCTGGAITAVPGSGMVAYSGGTAATGVQCTVQADVTTSVPGTYVNTSGDLTSSLGNSGPATDTLEVTFAALTFDKAFAPTIVQPGETSTLTLTIDNPINGVAVGSVAFTDTLPAGMTVATPANASTTCTGGTLTATPGSSVVSYTGGTVAATANCTVTVDVIGDTVGDLVNTTGDLTSDAGTTAPATATLTVIEMISLTKEFLTDPVLRGGLVDIQFTIANRGTTTLTEIAFTDDLDAALTGMVAVGLPLADVCGAGSSVTGTSVISLVVGSVASGENCVFTVTAKIPAAADLGMYTNTTSPMAALANGVPVSSLPASDDFEVVFLGFAKSFTAGSVTGGFTTTLTFSITNPDPANAAMGITFMDDLDAVLPGLMAVGLPMADVCGAGSSVTGSSLVTLNDGMVAAGGSCTFDVTVLVPEMAPAGTVTNVTGLLQAVVDGSSVTGDAAGVAMADLMIDLNILQVPTLGTWGALFLALFLALLAVRRLSPR